MHSIFSVFLFGAVVAVLVLLAVSAYTFFFRKDRCKTWLIRAGIAFGVLVVSLVGVNMTMTPEQRAEMEQKRIAKQAQEQAEKEEKKVQTAADKKQQDEQKAAEKKQKAEQNAKTKEQAAADAAAQKVYDNQAKYEAWIPQRIEFLCRQALKENFVSVDINDDLGKMDGSKIVLVRCQANMNVFSDEQLRRSLMIQSSRTMEALYKEDLPISEVTIFANGGLIDKYGNKSTDTIMKCSLSNDTAKKINWKHVNDLVMSFQDMLD